jgi:enoyl-CoA hydratase/carnithine racemase
MSEDLQVSTSDGICEVRISRPKTKNSFLSTMYGELTRALDGADADDGVRVVLVHGEGGNFSSGNDLNDFVDSPPTNAQSAVFRFLQRLHAFGKQVIAAVDGFAVGIGTTMLLHCDVVRATKALLKQGLNAAIAERIDVEAETFCKTLREPAARPEFRHS